MNNLGSEIPASLLSIPIASPLSAEPAHRLIVLFPVSDSDILSLSNRIWEFARSFRLNVLLLGLFNHFEEEALLRRRMITIASMIKDPDISIDILIEEGNDWVGQIKKISEPGGILTCSTGQRVGFGRKPLEQILRTRLGNPVYLLSGNRSNQQIRSAFLSKVYSWSGSLAIIGGFFWVEVKIAGMPHDLWHTTLIYACLLLEIPLILIWNSIFP